MTSNSGVSSPRWRFGPFLLDPSERTLFRDGEPVALSGRPFETLVYLVRNSGRLVTREELLREVWGGAAVEDSNVHWTISVVRKALALDETRAWITTVHRHGYRFDAVPEIVPRNPADEPESSRTTVRTAEEAAGGSRRPLRRAALSAMALLAVAAGAAVGWRAIANDRRPRPLVAVLGFHRLGVAEPGDWLGGALTELVSADLATGQALRTVPAEDVERVRRELLVPDVDGLSPATLVRLRDTLGSDYVLAGSYLRLPGGQGLRVEARLQEALGGGTLAAATATGTERDLFAVVDRLSSELRAHLGVPVLSVAEQAGSHRALPADPEAARLYTTGLERLRTFDFAAARDLLEGATARDGEFALAHSALARALDRLGESLRAKAEARLALEHSAVLSPAAQGLIRARFAAQAHDWSGAQREYGALWQTDRDDHELGLELCEAEIRAYRFGDAERTLAELRARPLSRVDRLRSDLLENGVALQSGDAHDADASSSSALAEAEALGSASLLRQALLDRAWALLLGGQDRAQARAMLDRARTAGPAPDRIEEIRMLDLEGSLAWGLDPAGAQSSYTRALALARAAGDRAHECLLLDRLAGLASAAGANQQAYSLWDQARDVAAGSGDERCRARALSGKGARMSDAGQLDEAAPLLAAALASARAAGDRGLEGAVLKGLAILADRRGDYAASRSYQESKLQLDERLGTAAVVVLDRLDLAVALLSHGDKEAAKSYASQAVAGAEKVEQSSIRSSALAVLADAERSLGDPDALARSAQAVSALDERAGEDARYRVLFTRASILLDFGSTQEARAIAERLQTAVRAQAVPYRELEVRFLLAEIVTLDGEPEAGLRALRDLAAEATEKGFPSLAAAIARDLTRYRVARNFRST